MSDCRIIPFVGEFEECVEALKEAGVLIKGNVLEKDRMVTVIQEGDSRL